MEESEEEEDDDDVYGTEQSRAERVSVGWCGQT